MQLSNNGAIQPITILVRYDNEFGEQEECCPGFITGGSHAMYVEEGRLIFVKVEGTSDPRVHLAIKGFNELGHINDASTAAATIEALVKKLHSMTAYEFLTDVVIHCKAGNFGNALLDNLVYNEA